MAFTVEDGTGLAGANSFATVEAADAYFADRGNTVWSAALLADKQIALVKATDYINGRFKFRGSKLNQLVQALEFPRVYLDNPVMPPNLLKATFEYAVRAVGGSPLAPDPTVDATGGAVKVSRQKVGPVETETEYHQSRVAVFKPYPAADMLLRDIVRPSEVIRG